MIFLILLLFFPGGIIWALIPAASKSRAEVEGTSGNSRTCGPLVHRRGICTLPHLLPGLSISPEFGPGAPEFEERNVLQLPPVDQFPLGCGRRESQVKITRLDGDLGDHLQMRKLRPRDYQEFCPRPQSQLSQSQGKHSSFPVQRAFLGLKVNSRQMQSHSARSESFDES